MNLKASTKKDAIVEIVNHLNASGRVLDKQLLIHDILAREELGSTGIGGKVAIPHSPTQGVEGFVMGFARSVSGIDFGSLDGDKVNLIFLMGTNPKELNLYLKTLAKLSKLLYDDSFRTELIAAQSIEDVLEAIRRAEG
jgi:PTS system nitrogen regulatory IIA component